ncbi:SDR family NAD(P)-dependent oxidoreductase [Runella sp.]|uniref:SDR family NAD(P)-dependent oxidoreductase n=1 Tax=Runella sp. TaxID=1960881 RepID=UPI003D0CA097
MKKTILITGASRGFGKIWAEAFLKRGDNVIATARTIDTLKDLVNEYGNAVLPLQLDVTNREQCFAVVNKAHEHFGKLDVVINNAGYGLFGTIEETSEQEARDQIETNVFGTLWVTQAVIPIMRNQGKGHIIQVSSLLGVVALPVLGLYNASKWAVEAISESMAPEIKSFGIATTIIEPNGFSTDWGGVSAIHSKSIPLYDDVKSALFSQFTEDTIGKPEATTDAILKVVDAENPPLRLFLGKVGFPTVSQVYADRLANWEAWKDVAEAAHG